MVKKNGLHGLDITEDLPFQRISWILERFGWVGMGVIILLAALGLFGDGPLSEAKAVSRNRTLQVQYQRFTRYKSPTTLQIALNTQRGNTVSVWLDARFLENIQIEEMDPPSLRATSDRGRTVYTYDISDTANPLMLRFEYMSGKIGEVNGTVGVTNGDQVQLRQFVYP